ncbi:MAG: hypothetical protein J3K34DRAFT_413397 [Monoraphidium minutum]|nr:MAG: hypothetical protein J3K34DRAFT_413397 [Monoraphidium minutum]
MLPLLHALAQRAGRPRAAALGRGQAPRLRVHALLKRAAVHHKLDVWRGHAERVQQRRQHAAVARVGLGRRLAAAGVAAAAPASRAAAHPAGQRGERVAAKADVDGLRAQRREARQLAHHHAAPRDEAEHDAVQRERVQPRAARQQRLHQLLELPRQRERQVEVQLGEVPQAGEVAQPRAAADRAAVAAAAQQRRQPGGPRHHEERARLEAVGHTVLKSGGRGGVVERAWPRHRTRGEGGLSLVDRASGAVATAAQTPTAACMLAPIAILSSHDAAPNTLVAPPTWPADVQEREVGAVGQRRTQQAVGRRVVAVRPVQLPQLAKHARQRTRAAAAAGRAGPLRLTLLAAALRAAARARRAAVVPVAAVAAVPRRPLWLQLDVHGAQAGEAGRQRRGRHAQQLLLHGCKRVHPVVQRQGLEARQGGELGEASAREPQHAVKLK